MSFTVVVLVVTYYYTNMIYNKKEVEKSIEITKQSFFYKLSYNKFYVDELYDKIIVKPIVNSSTIIYKWIDKAFIDGTVNGLGQITYSFGSLLRNVQSGNVGLYVIVMVGGIAAILFFVIIKSFAL